MTARVGLGVGSGRGEPSGGWFRRLAEIGGGATRCRGPSTRRISQASHRAVSSWPPAVPRAHRPPRVQFGFHQEMPAGATARRAFANALGQVAASSRVLLVIDGLDRLDPSRQGTCTGLAPGRVAARRPRRGLRRPRRRPGRADPSRLARPEGRATAPLTCVPGS